MPMHPGHFTAELKKWLAAGYVLRLDGGDVVHGRATLPALHSGPLAAAGTAGHNRLGASHSLACSFAIQASRSLDHRRRFARLLHCRMDTAVRHGLPVVMIVGTTRVGAGARSCKAQQPDRR